MTAERGREIDAEPASRLISRPRLTSLLDATPSHIVVLVGPAGYGKTTLAREWLSPEARRSTWYRGGPSSLDIAALMSGIALAMDEITPGLHLRMYERLLATRRAEDHTQDLADVILESLDAWPDDSWLVIDDYHYLMNSRSAEEAIQLLSEDRRLNMLVTSRHRPNWATPRRLLYGEVFELPKTALAMTLDEAAEVVSPERRKDLPALLALTEGWPAVIGLAALAVDANGVENELPESLYQFFAEELFQAADSDTQMGLCELSLMPTLPLSAASRLLGTEGLHVLQKGERLGFLSRGSENELELHPLLRAFLRRKIETTPDALTATISKVLPFLHDTRRWDDAYGLVSDYKLDSEFVALIEAGMHDLLANGRVATIEQWIRLARDLDLDDPVVELMDAEVVFRRGHWTEAERLCDRAVRKLGNRAIKSRAHFRAGQSSQLAEHHEVALEHHREASKAALSASELSQALWGMFITQCELERYEDASLSLIKFDEVRTSRTEDQLRSISGRITLAVGAGGLNRMTRTVAECRHLIEAACDPVVRCGFLQTLGSGLCLVAGYREALEAIVIEVSTARKHGLSFVLPHALCNDAVAHLGLREYRNCEASLAAADASSAGDESLHVRMNVAAIRARLYLTRGKPNDAAAITLPLDWAGKAARGMAGDYLATHALALASLGDVHSATRMAQRALSTSRQVESRVLSAGACAIAAIQGYGDPRSLDRLVEEMRSTDNRDSVICAFRAYPPLLVHVAKRLSDSELSHLISNREDRRLAQKLGLEVGDLPNARGLSPREREVLELLRRGMTNREIAQALWISEPTAKVHVRNILRKLEVRTRTAAALSAENSYADITAADNDPAAAS